MHNLRLSSLAMLVLFLGACYPAAAGGAGHTGADKPSAETRQPCPEFIEIQDFAFNPASCWVEAGATLTFVNNDQAPHTATSSPGAPAAFDTGTLQPGQSATVTFEETGAYPYFCQIHPSMQATITVRPGDDGGEVGDDADEDEADDEEDDDSDSGYGY